MNEQIKKEKLAEQQETVDAVLQVFKEQLNSEGGRGGGGMGTGMGTGMGRGSFFGRYRGKWNGGWGRKTIGEKPPILILLIWVKHILSFISTKSLL